MRLSFKLDQKIYTKRSHLTQEFMIQQYLILSQKKKEKEARENRTFLKRDNYVNLTFQLIVIQSFSKVKL